MPTVLALAKALFFLCTYCIHAMRDIYRFPIALQHRLIQQSVQESSAPCGNRTSLVSNYIHTSSLRQGRTSMRGKHRAQREARSTPGCLNWLHQFTTLDHCKKSCSPSTSRSSLVCNSGSRLARYALLFLFLNGECTRTMNDTKLHQHAKGQKQDSSDTTGIKHHFNKDIPLQRNHPQTWVRAIHGLHPSVRHPRKLPWHHDRLPLA